MKYILRSLMILMLALPPALAASYFILAWVASFGRFPGTFGVASWVLVVLAFGIYIILKHT